MENDKRCNDIIKLNTTVKVVSSIIGAVLFGIFLILLNWCIKIYKPCTTDMKDLKLNVSKLKTNVAVLKTETTSIKEKLEKIKIKQDLMLYILIRK